jgi:hypothetical protein
MIGLAIPERTEERRQQVLARGGHRGYPQRSVPPTGDPAHHLGTLLEQGEDVSGVAGVGLAAAVGLMLRPARSVRSTLSSRSSAATAAETEAGSPPAPRRRRSPIRWRTTARKAESWVTVTATQKATYRCFPIGSSAFLSLQ